MNEIPPESIAGFVTCLHEENWWLACVLEVCSDNKEVKLTFLHPHGPSNSFKYPEPQNIHTIPMDDILTLVDPRTRSGRVYSLTKRNYFCYQTASHCFTTVINLYYMPLSQLVYLYYFCSCIKDSCVSVNINQQIWLQGVQYCMGFLL